MSDHAGWTAEARPLLAGSASGELLVLEEPLSLWGGLDPASGLIIDAHHPQRGATVRGSILAMPRGRGSSSSSTVLAEAIRAGAGPAALLLREADGILLVGALVAQLLYARTCPVVRVRPRDYARLRTGDWLTLDQHARLDVRPLT